MVRVNRHVRTALGVAGATLLLLVVLEGTVQWFLFGRMLWSVQEPLAERVHTEHDELLGWIHLPNVRIADCYGPGRTLTTNSQRFRATTDYGAEPPPGRVRVVCSGDSFTLGYGVGDEQTWCHLLGEVDPRLEPVNMGQGGYGNDQAFLWYRRDGAGLGHRVHVFSFIFAGFDRMKSKRFIGYPKPRLRLSDGELVADNVPVPEGALASPRATQWAVALEQLGLYRAVRRLATPAADVLSDAEVRALSLAMFAELDAQNRAHGSQLLLVWLPTPQDLAPADHDLLRYFVGHECAARGWAFLDLVEPVRALAPAEAAALFDGHFTTAGNRWAAERIAARIGGLLDG